MSKQKHVHLGRIGAYSIAIALLIACGSSALPASAATTALTQQVLGGSLSVVSQPTASLGSVSTSTAAQTSNGSLGTITVVDTRGTALGWSNTVSCSNFTAINPVVKVAGVNNTVTSGGTYTGSAAGTYTVTILTAGILGTATYAVSGLETQVASTVASTVNIGTRGLTLNFGSANYAVGDSWTIRVDSIPVTNLTMTPSAITTNSGSASGVTAGSAHTFTSTSDATSVMTAGLGNGAGSYSNTPALSLNVPANTLTNTYLATVTETVQ